MDPHILRKAGGGEGRRGEEKLDPDVVVVVFVGVGVGERHLSHSLKSNTDTAYWPNYVILGLKKSAGFKSNAIVDTISAQVQPVLSLETFRGRSASSFCLIAEAGNGA